MIQKEWFYKRFDTSLINPDATDDEVIKFIEHCKEWSEMFSGIAFNLHQVSLAAKYLKGTDIKVCAPIAYPLGDLPTEIKIAQAENAIKNGATQLDIVMAVDALIEGNFDAARKDAEEIVKAVGNKVESLSLIADIAYLTDEQKLKAYEIVRDSGADVFKTNTGYGLITEPQEVAFIREKMGHTLKIMVAGGVRSFERAVEVYEAGADLIATSTPFAIFDTLNRVVK